jgi:pimeloyl-ACP methyl ester carboxylesterase
MFPSSTPGIMLDTSVYLDEEWEGTTVPLAICIHGFTGQNGSWGPLPSDLVRLGYAVASYTLRGHAGSDGRLTLAGTDLADVECIAHVVAETYRQLIQPAGMLLVGYSVGGWIARRVAAASTRFERVVLVAPMLQTTQLRPTNSDVELAKTWLIQRMGRTLSSLGESLLAFAQPTLTPPPYLRRLLDVPLGRLALPTLYILLGQDTLVSNAAAFQDFHRCTHDLSALAVLRDRPHAPQPARLVTPVVVDWLGGRLARWSIDSEAVVPLPPIVARVPGTTRLDWWGDRPLLLETPLLSIVGLGTATAFPWALHGAVPVHTLGRDEWVFAPVQVACEVSYERAPFAHFYVYCLLRTTSGSVVLVGSSVVDPVEGGVLPGVWHTRRTVLMVQYPRCPGGGVLYIVANRVRVGRLGAYPPFRGLAGSWPAGVHVRNWQCTIGTCRARDRR